MFRFACSLLILACFTLSAAADIPPPPPEAGFKRVPYEIVMQLATEMPTYKFYTFRRLGIGGRETIGGELQLSPDDAVAVPSSSSASVWTGVLAVPQRLADELDTPENLAKLLSRENQDRLPDGVVIYDTYGTIRDLKQSDPRTKVVSVVTVSLDDDAGVKFTARETPPKTTNKGAALVPTGRSKLANVVAGVASSLAIVLLVLWQVRRKQRRPSP